MNRSRLLIVAVVVCGVLVWILALMRGGITSRALGVETDALVPTTEPISSLAELPPNTDANREVTREHMVLDKAKRDAMREAIYRAWGMRPPDEHTNPATWPTVPASASGEGFGKDYIQQRIRDDYIPLARDCYEQGLKKNPQLAGKLVTSFRIVGTKGTGGLIDWVDTASEDNTLDDKDVIECLNQSMYSVTFDPPPGDGVVTVTYPLVFAPDDPDGG